MKTKLIEDYSLGAFLKAVVDAVAEGYELDLESNERAPQSFGGYYYVVLVDKDEEPKETKVSKPRKKKEEPETPTE